MKKLSISIGHITFFSALLCLIVFVPLSASDREDEKELEKNNKPLKSSFVPQFSTTDSDIAVLRLQINAWEEKEADPNIQESKVAQNSMPNQGDVKKKRKRKKKQQQPFSAQPEVINIFKNVVVETMQTIEPLIQKVIQEKIEEPQKVRVLLNRKDLGPFYEAFLPHIQKNIFPFTWSMINKGSSNSSNEQAPWVIEITFKSYAKLRERVEKEFVYQISEEDRQKVNWENIFAAAMRSGLTPEDFRFNKSIKVRAIELKGDSETQDLQEFEQLLSARLPKDGNPFHILSMTLNRRAKGHYGEIYGAFLQKVSDANIGYRIPGMVVDLENGLLYLFLDNSHRKILDLHGKQLPSGKYEGRSEKTAEQETPDFIMQAYETFKNEVTVLTGRGNHINANGQKGVLKEAFEKWMGTDLFSAIIKNYSALEGDGGYKVKFKKIQNLDLTRNDPINFIPLITQTICQMPQQKQTRLHIILKPQDVGSIYDREFALITSVFADLQAHHKDLAKLIIPISIELTPGKIKVILNREHPKSPKFFTFADSYGSPSVYGTIQ